MDSLNLEVLRRLAAWRAAGRQAGLVTVVRTWGSSPRPPGSLLALCESGEFAGSVSGGCVEDDLLDRRLTLLAAHRPQVLTYGVTREQVARFGLPCGGMLELVFEPRPDRASLQDLLQRLACGEPVSRRLNVHTGAASLAPGCAGAVFEYRTPLVTVPLGPRARLFLVGANALSVCLAGMAPALDYAVSVCDPRAEHALSWSVTDVPVAHDMPDDWLQAARLDSASAVVAVSHDPRLDDLALLEALPSAAYYVGALGSRGNTQKRCERLALLGLASAHIARLKGPVGLSIGSRTPAEIAVAVLADLIAARNGIRVWTERDLTSNEAWWATAKSAT